MPNIFLNEIVPKLDTEFFTSQSQSVFNNLLAFKKSIKLAQHFYDWTKLKIMEKEK